MAEFASPEWIEAVDRAAASSSIDPEIVLTIEQHLTGPAPTAWHFVFADGTVRVLAGPADQPTIVLTSSAETARAIHDGTLSAQRAFLDGELRIGGDLNELISRRALLAEVAALTAAAI